MRSYSPGALATIALYGSRRLRSILNSVRIAQCSLTSDHDTCIIYFSYALLQRDIQSSRGCLSVLVYLEWFRRNSLLICVLQPKMAKKLLKPPIFGVEGRSRSSMSVPPESSSAVLVMKSSKSVSICNHSHARRANSGKITISKGVPLFDALVQWLLHLSVAGAVSSCQ